MTRCGSTRTEPGPQDMTQKPCDQGSKVIMPGNHETLTDLLKRAASWGGSAGLRADGAGAARCVCHMASPAAPPGESGPQGQSTLLVPLPDLPHPRDRGGKAREMPPTRPVTMGAGPERCPPPTPRPQGQGPGDAPPPTP